MSVGTNISTGGGRSGSVQIHCVSIKIQIQMDIYFSSPSDTGPYLPKISTCYICHFNTIVFENIPPKYFLHVRSRELSYVKVYLILDIVLLCLLL